MPLAAPRPCAHQGCRALVHKGMRCALHQVKAGTFADSRRGTRKERGYGHAWDVKAEATRKEQAGLCQPHLRRGLVVTGCRTVDHVLAKAFGGGDEPTNRQLICKECHDLKTAAEGLLMRGLTPSGDPEVLASLTPWGGVKVHGASGRTERFAELCTPTKTTPLGVRPVRVR